MTWEVDPAALLAPSARRAGQGSDLAGALLGALNPDGSQAVSMRQGKVVSFSTSSWTATVTVAGSSVQVPGVPHMQDYQLAANDPVWLVKYGPGYAVIGSPTAAKRADDARIAAINAANTSSARIVRHLYRGTFETASGGYANGSGQVTANVAPWVPTNATLCTVQFTQPAHADINSAGTVYLQIQGENVEAQRIHTLGSNTQNLSALTIGLFGEYNVTAGTQVDVKILLYVDGGGGWIATHPGKLTITMTGIA